MKKPQTLEEIHHTAVQHFRDNALRPYHNGRLLHHQSQLDQVQDGETIVFKRADRKTPHGPAADVNRSTNQADFVNHGNPLRRPPARTDDEATLTEEAKGYPFDGGSRYAADYCQPQGVERVRLMKPAATVTACLEPLGKSTYAEQFPWRNPKGVAPTKTASAESTLSASLLGRRFDSGCVTSYTADFLQPHNKGEFKRTTRCPPLKDSAVLVPQVTETGGKSSYADSFNVGHGDFRSPSSRPPRTRARCQPFLGSSEYQRHFADNPVASTTTPRSAFILFEIED